MVRHVLLAGLLLADCFEDESPPMPAMVPSGGPTGAADTTAGGSATTGATSTATTLGDLPPPGGPPGCEGFTDALLLPAVEGIHDNVCEGDGEFGQLVLDPGDERFVCVGEAGIFAWTSAPVGEINEEIMERWVGFFTYWDPAAPNQTDAAQPKYVLLETHRYPSGWGMGCNSSAGFDGHSGSRIVNGDIASGERICVGDDAHFVNAGNAMAITVTLSSGEVCQGSLHPV